MAHGVAYRVLLAAILFGLTFLFLGVSARAWGSWSGLLANPARAGAVLAVLAATLIGALSPFNVSEGRRADFSDAWLPALVIVASMLLAWLPPYFDSRERWGVDGDAVRWIGLTLLVAGLVLRVWPIFVLGQRFSALVAIQEKHELVTDGPYRWIRNPSYLGGLISVFGWALVFRSVVGVFLAVLSVWPTIVRIRAEEALLASEFGSQYAAYRRRTWRLLPWMY